MFYSKDIHRKAVREHIDLDQLANDILGGLVFTTSDFLTKDDFIVLLSGIFRPLSGMYVKQLKDAYEYGDGVLFFYQYYDKKVPNKKIERYPVFDSCYQLNKTDYNLLIRIMEKMERDNENTHSN